jgi:hypothetical protein
VAGDAHHDDFEGVALKKKKKREVSYSIMKGKAGLGRNEKRERMGKKKSRGVVFVVSLPHLRGGSSNSGSSWSFRLPLPFFLTQTRSVSGRSFGSCAVSSILKNSPKLVPFFSSPRDGGEREIFLMI